MPRTQELAKIMFYRVEECGYFPYQDRAHSFFGLRDTLNCLERWLEQEGRTLSETSTYQPSEDSDELPVYCYDFVKHPVTQDILITTWNEVPSVNGQVGALNGREQVGHADYRASNFPIGYIPGFATYFWFIPERGEFATIRFDKIQNGQSGLRNYLWGFLAHHTPHVFQYEDEQGELCQYYGQDAEDDIKYRPVVKTKRIRMSGRLNLIRAQRHNISKVVQKTILHPLVEAEDRDYVQVLLSGMGLAHPRIEQRDLELRNEFKYIPTENELEEIIDRWREDRAVEGSADVGFKMVGRPHEVQWLSQSLAKSELSLIFNRINDEIIEGSSLLDALIGNKEQILNAAFREAD